MEEDQDNLKLEDSNQLALKEIAVNNDEELKNEASSSKENKESKSSNDSAESLQKEEEEEKGERCRSKTPTAARSSPEPNCAICLEQLQNKSFTDSCFHMFCFTCLVEWSKVKPECPLCKQSFKSIVHNVRSFKDYDQYYIKKARITDNLWIADRRFFQYSTTLTRDRNVFEEISPIYPRFESAIAHRMRFAPHSVHPVRMHSSTQTTSRIPCPRRRRVYEDNLWVRPMMSNRVRNVSPSFYRQNIACTHRLLPWLNRELLVVMPNNESQISFVIELIMALLVKYEITSQEFFTHIEPYTANFTSHFIHEFYNFASSPYESMDSYDLHSEYGPLSFPAHQATISSPDSDIIPLVTLDSFTRRSTEPSKKKKQHHSKKKHPKEFRKLKKIVLKRNTEKNCWESVPSSAFLNFNSMPPRINPFEVPGPSTSAIDLCSRCPPEISNNLDESNEVECLEGGLEDEECQVVEVLKPKRERTPEIVDLLSDNEKETVVDVTTHEFSDDTDISCYEDALSNKTKVQTMGLFGTIEDITDDDDDIQIVSDSKIHIPPAEKPIDYSYKPSEKRESIDSGKNDVEASSSSSKPSECSSIPQAKSTTVRDLGTDDALSSSPVVRPKKRRAVLLDDSSTESCSEAPQVAELNSQIKKLKLRSVVAHFSFDEPTASTHHSSSSSHKKHKDKKKKKKKHKHRRSFFSSDSN